jgi:monoamine oxidase
MKPKECVVIGAGLSGLAAAYHLTRNSWKVTVLEVTRRPGGRVMTHRFGAAPGLVCELGGEWIGNDHHEMRRLCREFELHLQAHQFEFVLESTQARAVDCARVSLCELSRIGSIP